MNTINITADKTDSHSLKASIKQVYKKTLDDVMTSSDHPASWWTIHLMTLQSVRTENRSLEGPE